MLRNMFAALVCVFLAVHMDVAAAPRPRSGDSGAAD